MTRWRKISNTWCYWNPRPEYLIEVIGGSYLGVRPQYTYKRLFEELSKYNMAIHSYSYLPLFDHQSQANEAWRNLRFCRKILEQRVGQEYSPIRIGHSLGCKLNLLSPDGGRNCKGIISISFNNFGAKRSIPLLKELSPKMGFKTEFNPNPRETLELIKEKYLQPNNLVIGFNNDKLDQSKVLIDQLKQRENDKSELIFIEGDHLTPVSAGLRKNVLGDWADNEQKNKKIKKIASAIYTWILKNNLVS